MDLVNKGEYTDSAGPEVIKEICERSRIGLIAALAERIDINKDYILSFREDKYERVTDQGNLMHGIKMAVSVDPIVRCKECRYCKRKKGTFKGEPIIFYRCEENNRDVESDDFCSYGERRE